MCQSRRGQPAQRGTRAQVRGRAAPAETQRTQIQRDEVEREIGGAVRRDPSRPLVVRRAIRIFQDRTEAVSRSQWATSATPGISEGEGPRMTRAAAPTAKRYTGATVGAAASTSAATSGVRTAGGGDSGGAAGGRLAVSSGAGGGSGTRSAPADAPSDAGASPGGVCAGGGVDGAGDGPGAARGRWGRARRRRRRPTRSRAAAAGSSASTITSATASAVSAQVGAVSRRSARVPSGHCTVSAPTTAPAGVVSSVTRNSGPPPAAAPSTNRIRVERRATSASTSARLAQPRGPVTASDASTGAAGSAALRTVARREHRAARQQ